MKKLLMILCAAGSLACAATPEARPVPPVVMDIASADRDAVVAAVQSLFDAMRTRDTVAIRSLFAPGAQLVSVRTVPGAPARMQVSSLGEFAARIAGAPEELVERMWDPRVEIGGDIASLWAPYDFRIGSNFSHCGHDAVHLVRTPEGWKIVGIAYTVQTTGCTAP